MHSLRMLGALAAPAVLLPLAGFAQTSPAPLSPLIVTATGIETPQHDALAPVAVISRAEIERAQATDLAELLRFTAGLEIGRTGGPGGQTSVFTRGGNSNHTLVLIDGVRINPATGGGAALQHLTPEQLERIEIVKGPRSTLYGSEAIAGVINLITRKPDGTGATASFRAGSDRTGELRAGGHHRWERLSVNADVGHLDTDGFAIRPDSDIRRGTRRSSGQLGARLALDGAELDARVSHAQGTAEFLAFGNAPQDFDFTVQTLSAGATVQALAIGATRLQLSRAEDDADQNQSADFTRTVRTEATLSQTIGLGAHTLVLTTRAAREEVDALSFGSAAAERRDIVGGSALGQFAFGPWSLTAAASVFDHDAFGTQTDGTLDLGYRVTEQWSLLASVGSGFRAPSLLDRFGFGGNPDLDSEQATQVEVGTRWQISPRQGAELRLFESRVRDLIVLAFDPSNDPEVDFGFRAVNVDRARNRGVDLQYTLALLAGMHLSVGAQIQNPVDRNSGDRLLRRSRNQLTANLTQTFTRWDWDVRVLAAGNRADVGTDGSILRNPGYALVDTSLGLRLNPNWRVQARIENLLDTDYQTAFGFNQQDRAGYLTLRYSR